MTYQKLLIFLDTYKKDGGITRRDIVSMSSKINSLNIVTLGL
jgi:hypothetical protein